MFAYVSQLTLCLFLCHHNYIDGLDYVGFNQLITLLPMSTTFEFNITIKADNIVELTQEVFEVRLSLDEQGPILIAQDGGTATISIQDAVG